MKKLLLSILAVILACCLLSGCYSTTAPSQGQATEPEQLSSMGTDVTEPSKKRITANHVFSADNLRGALPGLSVFPAEAGFYYSNSAKFYDIAQQTSIFLCSRPGCTHGDDSCPAALRGMEQILACDGVVYAFCFDNDLQELTLVEVVPQTGERTTVFTLTPEQPGIAYGLNYSLYAYGRIYFKVMHQTKTDISYTFYFYELSTRKTNVLVECSELEYFELLGAGEEYAYFSCSALKQAPMSFEEYLRSHIEASEDEYAGYLDSFYYSNSTSSYRKIKLDTMESSDFADELRGDSTFSPNLNYSSAGSCFGQYLLYKLGDQVLRYDMNTGERESLVEAEHICNGFLMDGRLIYLVNGEDSLTIHAYDPQTGEDVTIDNAGNSGYMTFSIHNETKNAFIGLYDGRNAWIYKEDFYNGNYDKAVFY